MTVRAQPADAQVFVDGKPAGAANQTLRLVATTHDIEIRKAGFVDLKTSVTPRPGVPQVIETTLLTAEQTRMAATPANDSHQGRSAAEADADRLASRWAVRVASRAVAPTKRSATSQFKRAFYMGVSEVTNGAVPQVQGRAQVRHRRPEHAGSRQSAGGEHHLAGSRGCSAIGCREQEGLPPAYKNGTVTARSPVTPMTTRLSVADRRGMGMGCALRGRRQVPALSVGRCVAGRAQLRQLCGSHRTMICCRMSFQITTTVTRRPRPSANSRRTRSGCTTSAVTSPNGFTTTTL